ncbi:MAG: hypothetical protein ACYC27_13740 [Armatimonadota bacterium]
MTNINLTPERKRVEARESVDTPRHPCFGTEYPEPVEGQLAPEAYIR